MRTIYATQLDLRRDGMLATEVFQRAERMLTEWIKSKYRRSWNADVQLPQDGSAEVQPLDRHALRCTRFEDGDACATTIQWSHPDDRDANTIWQSSVELVRYGDAVELSIVIRLIAEQMVLRPLRFTLGRPGVVSRVLEEFQVRIGEDVVSDSIRMLGAQEIDTFVEGVLLRPTRSLPVVIISPDSWTENPIAETAEIFDAVRGSAHVAVMSNKWAAFKLTDVVGRELSCYDGAVRVYWPGFSEADSPFMHRLYLPHVVRSLSGRRPGLGQQMFRMLAAISSFRFVPGPASKTVARRREDAAKAKTAELRQHIKKGDIAKQDLEDQLLDALARVEALEGERDQLKEDLDAQKAAWAEYQSFMASGDPPASDAPPKPAEGEVIETVGAAVRRAKEDLDGPLVFLDSAVESADSSPYQNPERVQQLFEALYFVADEWRKNKGSLGRSWGDALAEFGFEYKPRVSETSRGKWGDEYSFHYKGEKRLFEHHITIGAKQADKCLSVHWYRDDDDRVLVIGHCGRHLTNTKT